LNIEIQLYFSDDGSVKSGPEGDFEGIDLSLYPVDGNIKEDEFFVHSNYGYLNLTYPGFESTDWLNITQNMNIPFEGNVIPRLHSVRFLKGSTI